VVRPAQPHTSRGAADVRAYGILQIGEEPLDCRVPRRDDRAGAGALGVFHGPRKLATYDAKGTQALTKQVLRAAA
jgi:hypothetical protein